MRRSKIKLIITIPLTLFALFYLVGVYIVASDDRVLEPRTDTSTQPKSIALFGGSGTTGDGILKAALASDEIGEIIVVTRRVTPRMTQGEAQGKVTIIEHLDYLDYSAMIDRLKDIDTVYWAIGITSIGTDRETYRKIHTDFPLQFLTEWRAVNSTDNQSFHFISSSDISEDSSSMWIQEKIHAEKVLFGFADETSLKVIAYRPDYIGPTQEEAHLGQDILYWFFRPVGAAIKAREIGQAMIEKTMRNDFQNGDKLPTRVLLLLSDAYEKLQSL